MGIFRQQANDVTQKILAVKALENRPRGLVGFDDLSAAMRHTELVDVIVEFRALPAGVAQAAATAVKQKSFSKAAAEKEAESARLAFPADLAAISPDSRLKLVYKNALNGAAVSIPANKLEQLLELSYVNAVYPDARLKLDTQLVPLGDGTPVVTEDSKADLKWIGMREGRKEMHVDALHARGIKGEGVVVGVIDSGLDYNHPDLSDAYIGGRNFISDQPADDPMDNMINSHGTHVTGTILARGVNGVVSALGMAPEALVRAYRVSAADDIEESILLEAIEYVAQDGCDIVNLSLSYPSTQSYHPISTALNSVALEHDILFVIAAGNNGYGFVGTTKEALPSSLGTPGNAALALTVANGLVPMEDGIQVWQAPGGTAYEFLREAKDWYSTIEKNTDGTYSILYDNLTQHEGHTYQFVPTKANAEGLPIGIGEASEYTPEVIEAVRGNIAVFLIEDIEYELPEAIANAKVFGAGGFLAINPFTDSTASDYINYYLGESADAVPGWFVDYREGFAFMREAHANGGYAVIADSRTRPGGSVHISSGRGPVPETFEIKPDVTSHGTAVLSTIRPERLGQDPSDYSYAYTRYTGTSMASPHIAGVAALLKGYSEANGLGWSAQDIKARITGTAQELPGQSIFDAGAGFADAQAAVTAELQISVPSDGVELPNGETAGGEFAVLSFGPANLVKPFRKTAKVILRNRSAQEKQCVLSHAFHREGTAFTVGYDSAARLCYPEMVVIPANSASEIDVTIELPAHPQKIGSFEGFLFVDDGKNQVKLPYAAAGGYGVPESGQISDLWLGRPVMSVYDNGQIQQQQNRSDVSDFSFKWKGSSSLQYLNITASVENSMQEQIGSNPSAISLLGGFAAGAHRYAAYTSSRYKISTGGTFMNLQPGLYYLNLLVQGFAAYQTWHNLRLPFVVDDTAPVVTVNEARDGVIPYTGGTVRITGNVYDEGMALAEEASLFYPTLDNQAASQQLNGLIAKLGTKYRRIELDADGNFDVSFAGLSGEAVLTLYAYDSYVPTIMESGTAYVETFDPDLPSYYDAASNTAYYGANKAVLQFRLIQE